MAHHAAGQMSDAGEVLLAIYGRIEALSPAAAQALAAVFGLGVQEYVYCERCEKKSRSHSYTQYFYNTQVRVHAVAALYIIKAAVPIYQSAECGLRAIVRSQDDMNILSRQTDHCPL
jgi:hypothetical protein